jgi:hypothetical protein
LGALPLCAGGQALLRSDEVWHRQHAALKKEDLFPEKCWKSLLDQLLWHIDQGCDASFRRFSHLYQT